MNGRFLQMANRKSGQSLTDGNGQEFQRDSQMNYNDPTLRQESY